MNKSKFYQGEGKPVQGREVGVEGEGSGEEGEGKGGGKWGIDTPCSPPPY